MPAVQMELAGHLSYYIKSYHCHTFENRVEFPQKLAELKIPFYNIIRYKLYHSTSNSSVLVVL